MSVFFSRFMGNESQCGTNKSRELRSFFLGSWEMNRSAKQTNRVNREDTHSFKKILFQYIHVFTLVLHAAG